MTIAAPSANSAADRARAAGFSDTCLAPSSGVSGNDAILAEVKLCEAAVRIGKIQLNGASGPRPAAPDFRGLEFEAADGLDADSMLCASYGIHDRLATLIDIVRHLQSRAPLVDVDLKIDVCKDRIVNSRAHGGIDVEHGGAGSCVLPRQDP